MLVTVFKSKLHRVKVTEAQLDYEGSITIDEELLKTANILIHEKVQVVNVNNGARLETYTIPGEWGSRTICLNSPAARMCAVGDEVIIITYSQMSEEEALLHHPKVVLVDENNDPLI